MSIEVEMNGKAGRVCQQALDGTIRCPCIVRTTSEDVVVGNVFGMLQHIRPHLWLSPILNAAYETDHHKQVWYKGLTVTFWKRQEPLPPELLSFKEGRTEPDLIVEWENPPTTLWIEAKWGSPMAKGTSRHRRNDQVIRGVRSLLYETGHFETATLIARRHRTAMWVALVVNRQDDVLQKYRDMRVGIQLGQMRVEHSIGVLTWARLLEILRWPPSRNKLEASIVTQTAEYLQHRLSLPKTHPRQNTDGLFA